MKLNIETSRPLLLILSLAIFVSCNGPKTTESKDTTGQVEVSKSDEPMSPVNAEMKVSYDGEMYMTEKVDWESSHANVVDDQIQYLLWNGEDPIQLNFNIKVAVKEKGAATYTIPDDNKGAIMLDLNFFDLEREVESRMNQRIIFRKGTISIREITDNKLSFSFEGEGSGMRERDSNFPIFGEVNVEY